MKKFLIFMLALSIFRVSASDIVTIQILGTGAASLLRSDLTDPENNGVDALGAGADPVTFNWNWVSISSSHEPDFEGGEFSFNIFDNKVGGGNDKWCCDDPIPGTPVWVSVEFANPVSITHFTVTTGNDSPDRDPTDWQIQGSADGLTYSPIYAFKESAATWATATRNQVIRFTLLSPSAPYKFIQYIAYATPGTLHQINEIEYFGASGQPERIAVSAIAASLANFKFNVTDVGASVASAANTTLTINGAPVTLTNAKVDGVTTFTYTPALPFTGGSTNVFVISAQDGAANIVSATGSFVTPAYAVLTAADKVTPDITKAGFMFNVHQNQSFQDNTWWRAENQLAGVLGANNADPAAQGPALAAGVAGANTNLPIHFEIDTTINMEQTGADAGDINPNTMIPGVPGLVGIAPANADGIAAEIITYVELTAGLHTFIFNRDDGFRTTVGNVGDVFQARQAGVFNAGGGATDTAYTVYAQEAGVYAFRSVWFEGGGGANLEWKTLGADGVTEILLNDFANGGLKAYRVITGAAPTVISSITPALNQTGILGDIQLRAVISEGAAAVDVASVKISLNGVQQADVATKTGNLITITHQPSALIPANTTNTMVISYTAGGVARSETNTFITGNFAILAAINRVTPDTTKPGFIWNVHHNPNENQGANLRALKALAGLYGKNFADPAAIGYALAEGVTNSDPSLPIMFEIDTVINMDQTAGSNGEFTPDNQMPGIPGLALNDGAPFNINEGISAEIVTYVDLPAGKNIFIFNSDDGFRSFGGNAADMFTRQQLGQFDAGRGAADTVYTFFTEAAGVYPIRTVWFEGGGGANLEWKHVKPDGTRALINDTINGGALSYRAATAGERTAVTKVSPWPGYGRVAPKDPIELVIQEGVDLVTDASIVLSLNGTPVSPAATVTRNGKIVTVRHVPSTAYTGGATNTAMIVFTVGGAARTNTWTFITPATIPDKVNSAPAMMIGRIAISADAGGRTAAAGDRALDFGTTGGTNPGLVTTDSALLSAVNATSAADTLSVSLWVKKYNNNNNSAFWFSAPSAMQAARNFQAHTPWSDGTVYFDSAGCCGANLSRINLNVNDITVPGYTGATWWNDLWHHWVFVKNGLVKQIWLDGVLFHSGEGLPLYSDVARIWIGAEGNGPDGGPGNPFGGLIDDFAIFGSGLVEADIVSLKNGTAPSALPAATTLLAWWDFNAGTVQRPSITITRSAGSVTLTWPDSPGRALYSSATVDGTYTLVAGVVGNSHTVSSATGSQFFILK